MKRLSLVFSRGTIAETLDEFDRKDRELQEFTHENKELETVRRKRRSPCPHEKFRLIRNHATSLYNIFVTGSSWSYDCKTRHTASLHLESRSERAGIQNGDDGSVAKFQVLLSVKDVSPHQIGEKMTTMPNWEWRELEVCSFELEEAGYERIQQTPSPVTPQVVNKT